MQPFSSAISTSIAPVDTALQQAVQQRPRPLPLFLDLLRSETAASPIRQAQALAGLRRYQEAARDPMLHAHRTLAAQNGAVRLWHIPADGPVLARNGAVLPPIVLVPSIINSHDILDLGPGRSLARFLAAQGHAVYLVDWGSPLAEGAALSIGDLVTARLVPLLATLDTPPVVIGYCLGGTIALAAACHLPVRALVTMAAPWHFGDYPAQFRADTAAIWEQGRAAVDQWGVLPMEVMQRGFWTLDTAATIGKFERHADCPDKSEAETLFTLVEDWANGGEPLGGRAAHELFDVLFGQDAAGAGAWQVGDRVIRPEDVAAPMLHVVSMTDRIVPHQSAIRVGERRDLTLGHVGMIIGGSARARLWEPLAEWLATIN